MRQLYLSLIALVCAYLFPQGLHANDSCNAAFTYSTVGNTASFKSAPGLAAGTIHNWIFGDGSPGDGSPNPVHTYAAAGTYWVKHYIFNQATNCNDSVIKEIRVPSDNCNIEAKFSFYRDSLDCRKIHFVNLSTPISANTHFIWKFGDGSTSNETNPTHIYPSDGNFTACLVVEASNTCRQEVCKTVEIRCSTPPCDLQNDFYWKISEENPRKVFFYSQSTPATSNVRYEWKFGDGTYANDKDPVHLYERAGEYEVCLTIKLGEHCKKTVCKKLILRDCDVDVRFEPRRDAAQWNKIWFANLSHPVPNIWRTSWTYGDGTSSQDFNSFHVYQQPGRYVVCLKVQSLQGCVDTYCDTVVVRRPDSCQNHSEFRYEIAANNRLEYRFKPAEVNLTWKYYWEFGDGKSSTAVAPIHKYAHPGVYRACLTVITRNGRCKTTTCKEIRVAPVINCDSVRLKFEYTRSTAQPNKLSFHAISNVPILKQKWAFQKMTLPVQPPVFIEANNPTYVFKDTGWYLVCLYAVAAGDCYKIYCERIHIERTENTVEANNGLALVIPNPVSSMARVVFEMEAAGPVTLRVLDASGSAQMTYSAPGQAGNNRIYLPVEKLGNGFYIVEIRYANRLKLAKFQKS